LKPRLYIGPAGWSYPDWNGVVYPAKKPRDFDPLEYISFYFNLIEINSTFYRLPTRETSRRWAERVTANPDFRFSLKAHKEITHSEVHPEQSAVDIFKSTVDPLLNADRLVCVLLQFPWSFRNTEKNRERLERTIRWFDPFPVSVELRHGGWDQKETVEAITGHGATVCAVDQPLVGDSLTIKTHAPGLPGPYFRLHGRNKAEWFRPGTNRDLRYNYLYSGDELKDMARAVREAMVPGTPVTVVLNNHFRGQAVANALELNSILSETRVVVPRQALDRYPRLNEIAAADPKSIPVEGWLFDPPSTAENNQ
jgi:uncharacterized protein YecE (DUF72 family)